MGIRKITLVLIIILAGLVLYNIFFGHSSVREAKQLTKELKQQVDTLKQVAGSYEKIQHKYVRLYAELNETRSKVADLKDRLKEINEMQTNDARIIRAQLRNVVVDFDSLDLNLRKSTTENADLDSLRF